MQVRFGNYPAVYGQTWTPQVGTGTWGTPPAPVINTTPDQTQRAMAEWARYWEAYNAQAAAAAQQWTTLPPAYTTAPPPQAVTLPAQPVQPPPTENANPFANAAPEAPSQVPMSDAALQDAGGMDFAPSQDAGAGLPMTQPAVEGNNQGAIAQALGSLLGQGGGDPASLATHGQPGSSDMAGGFGEDLSLPAAPEQG